MSGMLGWGGYESSIRRIFLTSLRWCRQNQLVFRGDALSVSAEPTWNERHCVTATLLIDHIGAAIYRYLRDATRSSARQLLDRKYHSGIASVLIEVDIDLRLDERPPTFG